jgi:hypothetical protein
MTTSPSGRIIRGVLTGTVVELPMSQYTKMSVSFAPDGHRLAISRDNEFDRYVQIWDEKIGSLQLVQQLNNACCAELSPE